MSDDKTESVVSPVVGTRKQRYAAAAKAQAETTETASETVVEEEVQEPQPEPIFVQLADGGMPHYIIKLAVDTDNCIAGLYCVDLPFKEDKALEKIQANWNKPVSAANPGARVYTEAEEALVSKLLDNLNIEKFNMKCLDLAFGRKFGNAAISIAVRTQ